MGRRYTERVAGLHVRRRAGERLTAGETMELAQAGVTIAARGGAKIWSMRTAWMPSQCTCQTDGRANCLRHKGQEGLNNQMDGADPDGFAVFGQFPDGFLRDVIRLKLLGDITRDEVLHVCSGTLGPRERWTVDIRAEARPSVIARGQALPFTEASFKAVLLDPPYTEEYARNLYRSEFPRPSHLLREAARVVMPGGRIGLLHIAVPITPVGCEFVTSFGLVPGPGFRIRAFTVYERTQAQLPFAGRDSSPRNEGRRPCETDLGCRP
jgi:hypothetical protein